MDSISQYFRKVKPGFLNRNSRQEFEIFYQVNNGDDEPTFLKFAEYNAGNHDRIIQMMSSDDTHDFFIHETDLIHYYKNFFIQNLEQTMKADGPGIKVLARSYPVAVQILLEYFENIGSPRVLRMLKPVLDLMAPCFTGGNVAFADVFRIASKSNKTYSHCVNVGLYCMYLASKLQMSLEPVKELGMGGMVADIGKKELPIELLLKPGELSPEERRVLRRHPSAGRKVLNDMKCFTPSILSMAAEHHEKFSGEGYPFGLAGEKISLFARVCAIMDAFDSLTCERTFHKPLSPIEALTVMKNDMPGHFDNRVFVNFVKTLAGAPQRQATGPAVAKS